MTKRMESMALLASEVARASRPRKRGQDALATSPTARRGSIFVVTLWIILALVALLLNLASVMKVEVQVAANDISMAQAAAVEQGAIQYVLANVDLLSGNLPDELDMPCEAVPVGNGYFWIIRPDDGWASIYGLTDERGKIDINTAPADVLENMPGMTPEIASAIIDWRDADSAPQPNGAESEHYLLLTEPYDCKNGPFESVGELLLVRDMTPELLFGEDANLNGFLDDNENDGPDRWPDDNADGVLDLGIHDLVTVRPAPQQAASTSGQQTANINQGGQLALVLTEVLGDSRGAEILSKAFLERPFANLLDFYYRTGLTLDEFSQLASRLTVGGNNRSSFSVNVNTATPEVLSCLPGLEYYEAEALAVGRAATGRDTSNIGWITEILSRDKAVAIAGYLATTTDQYSADIVSVSPDGRAFRRCRVWIDGSGDKARVVRRQDLTNLGWPLEPEILDELRSGQAAGSAANLTSGVR